MRHEAGELTLGEVELLREQVEAAQAAANDGESSHSSDDEVIDAPSAESHWQAPLGQRLEL